MEYEEDMVNKVGRKSLEIQKGSFKYINQRSTDNIIIKRKRIKGQTTTYKAHKIKDRVTRIPLVLQYNGPSKISLTTLLIISSWFCQLTFNVQGE
jgi:hypothetical protein